MATLVVGQRQDGVVALHRVVVYAQLVLAPGSAVIYVEALPAAAAA